MVQEELSKAVDSFLRARTGMLEDAIKSLLMFGWATDELVVCHYPDHRTAIRVGGPNGRDVFEQTITSPGLDDLVMTVQGRWVDWPYKY